MLSINLCCHAVCPNLINLNETSGVITTPFYPRKYPNNQACSWEITATKGKRIVLIIEDMQIQQCGSSCSCDYLEIQNGVSSDAALSVRRCGNSRFSAIFHSVLESLKVLFVSDGGVRYPGFKATYTQVNFTAISTGKYQLNSFTDVLQSYPGACRNNLDYV